MASPRPQTIIKSPLTDTAEWEIADCYYKVNFLYRYPILFNLPAPSVYKLNSASELITEIYKHPIGTQFVWSVSELSENDDLLKWRHLGWRGVELGNRDISLIPIDNLISEVLKSSYGIIQKNYLICHLLEKYKLSVA